MYPNNFFFFVGLFLLQVSSKPRELYVGSKCHNSNVPGICALLTNCSSALEAVKEQHFHNLERCGFVRDVEVVCCPISELRHVKTTEKPTTDDGNPSVPEVRGRIRKSEKACKRYSSDLRIVLSWHIVAGKDAELGEFPHMVALGFFSKEDNDYKFDCGGTLISNHYIVTAAHCIINVQQNELKIARMGVIDVPEAIKNPDPKIDFNVVNVTVHQDYNWKEKLNDIALVKLQKKVNFTDNIRPACLYAATDDPQWLVVTGWGAVSLGGEKSSILQKASLSIVPLPECNVTYQTRTNRIVTKRQLCAADSVSDACQGDSGGPLQTQTNSSLYSIVGITSYGIGCASSAPGIYTRISSYLDWIEGIVWP